jgi:hypothetical protein
MNTKCTQTKTVSLSLNFNSETQFYFTVEIPRELYTFLACELFGVNAAGKSFQLKGLGEALMRLLVELGLADERTVRSDPVVTKVWRVHASPKRQRIAAVDAEVKSTKKV